MRIALTGRNLEDLEKLLTSYNEVEIVSEAPDVVISYGGDGSLLGAERLYPGIPKCPIRDSRSAPKCPDHDDSRILEAFFAGQLKEASLVKLKGYTDDGAEYVGLNDILLNRTIHSSAMRYRLWLEEDLYVNEIVGDGLIAATPFGSTGYYRSITNSVFHVGFGIAFNNATESISHIVVDQTCTIRVEVLRGPAILTADNDLNEKHLTDGDIVHIEKHPSSTTVMGLETFRCPQCYRIRHPYSPAEARLQRRDY